MRTFKTLLILAIAIYSCKSSEERFTAGAIRQPGVYKIGDSLSIEISIKEALVRYSVKDFNGKLKIETVHSFSDYQAWAFYLEDNGTFWVISSDIGYAYFKADKNGNYTYHELPRRIDLQKIPESLVRDLSEFFD